MESIQNTIKTPLIQYNYNYIISIRNRVSSRLPLNVYNKIVSYQKFGGKKKSSSKLNKFLLSRNPELVNPEEVKIQVRKEIRSILNRVSARNLDSMKEKISSIIILINKVEVKTEIHKILMSMLLDTAVSNKSLCNVYAKLLQEMSLKIELDYRDYLDNLFVDIKKCNREMSFSNDYNKFCKQIADKDKFLGLFDFIGELFKMKMLETVLIKKYIMILLSNITKAGHAQQDISNLEMETNAQCIKGLLLVCNKKSFYELVYPKFNMMKNNKRYKMKLRFILMDITEKYDKYK